LGGFLFRNDASEYQLAVLASSSYNDSYASFLFTYLFSECPILKSLCLSIFLNGSGILNNARCEFQNNEAMLPFTAYARIPIGIIPQMAKSLRSKKDISLQEGTRNFSDGFVPSPSPEQKSFVGHIS
jgi:hypothetical protein